MSGRVSALSGAAMAALICGGLAACREILPDPARDGPGPGAPVGWRLAAIYADDPTHPANRWFQRVFSERDAAGRLVPPRSDEPRVPAPAYGPVDRAEIGALLGALSEEGLPSGTDPVTRALLRADLLAASERLRAAGADGELAQAYAAALEALPAPPVSASPRLDPPPLRTGSWRRVRGPLAPGFVARPADPRDTRIFYDFGAVAGTPPPGPTSTAPAPARAALVRYRRFVDPGGDPSATGLAGEAWLLERRDDRVVPRLFRFDRARWLAGEGPWTELPAGSPTRIRNPTDPDGPTLSGTPAAVCLPCHPAGDPFPSRREGFYLEP